MKCKLVKHKGAPTLYNEIFEKIKIRLKMQIHWLSLDEGVRNLNPNKELR
jgi:hypothetical protein